MAVRFFGKYVLSALAFGLGCFLTVHCGGAAEADSAEPPVGPEALRKTLDPFYKQHVVAGGLLIVGSEKVSPHALNEAAYLTRKLLANRPDVMEALGGKRRMYACVMAYTEMQTDLPECRGMDAWWDYRARGLGGGSVSCGEENLLCFEGDAWQGESIFIHEFAHGLQGVIGGIDEKFNTRLAALYKQAKDSGRYQGYAIEGGIAEFWAEGVQAWFNCNGTIRPESGGGQSSFEVLGPNGEHVCHLTTRQQIKEHLPEYAKLLDESFRQNKWTYVPVADRLDEPHLRGFDPGEAPEFRWPPEVVEAFRLHQARQALKNTHPWANVSAEQVAAAKRLGVAVAIENSAGMRFVLIPAGTFTMGSRDPAAEVARRCNMPNAQAGWFEDEHPRHKVTLTTACYLSIHEVTQAQYAAITRPEPKEDEPGIADDYPDGFAGADRPVLRLALNDIERFCKTLASREEEQGRQYSLPTEAQWEYACRCGATTPFGFGETLSTKQANYHGDYTYGDGRKSENRAKPLPVGSLRPNAWGLYDLHGNVSEWCADRYGPYADAAATDPTGPDEGRERVVRGGSWRSYPGACRSACRVRMPDGTRADHVGFRVCCVVVTDDPEDGD